VRSGLLATGVHFVGPTRLEAVTPGRGRARIGPRDRPGRRGRAGRRVHVRGGHRAVAIDPGPGAINGGTWSTCTAPRCLPSARLGSSGEASHIVVRVADPWTCRTPPGRSGRLTSGWRPGARSRAAGPVHLFRPDGAVRRDVGRAGRRDLERVGAGRDRGTRWRLVCHRLDRPEDGASGLHRARRRRDVQRADLVGQQMVSASKDCYDSASVVAFDAVNVTLYLQYTCPSQAGCRRASRPRRSAARCRAGQVRHPAARQLLDQGHGSRRVSCLPCWSGDADCGGNGQPLRADRDGRHVLHDAVHHHQGLPGRIRVRVGGRVAAVPAAVGPEAGEVPRHDARRVLGEPAADGVGRGRPPTARSPCWRVPA